MAADSVDNGMWSSQAPAGWSINALNELCERLTDGSHFSPIPRAQGLPIVNVKDLKDGRVDVDSCTKIAKVDFDALIKNGCGVNKDDVLLSKDGTIGKVVVYREDEPLVALSSIALLKPGERVTSAFVGHALQSADAIRQYGVFAGGSALKRLVLRDIGRLTLLIPPRPEQETITTVLDLADEMIERTRIRIDKLRFAFSGMLQDILTRGVDQHGTLRNPLSSPNQFKTSALGVIPAHWDIVTLDRLADVIDPQPSHRAPPEVENGIPYVGVGDFLPDGTINFASCRKVSPEALLRQSMRFRVQTGDILFGKIGTIGSPRLLPGGSYALNANTVLIKPFDPCSFVFWVLNSNPVEAAILADIHSTSQPAFGIQKIRSLEVPCPKDEVERERIAAILDQWIAAIRIEGQLLAKLGKLKAGLMSDLLTGDVRLPESGFIEVST